MAVPLIAHAQTASAIDWTPRVTRQSTPFECGYVCCSAILAMFGREATVSELKVRYGDSARGISLSVVKKIMQENGAVVRTIAFDATRVSALPSPGILLLKKGHFVVLGRKLEKYVEVFFPESGWCRYRHSRLSGLLCGLGLLVESVGRQDQPKTTAKEFDWELAWLALQQSFGSFGARLLTLYFFTQVAAMLLPLVTKISVDSLIPGHFASSLSAPALAFTLLMLINSLMGAVYSWGSVVFSTRVSLASSTWFFDRLASTSNDVFQQQSPSQLYGQFGAVQSTQRFYADIPSRLLRILLCIIVGGLAIIFVSPWLVVISVGAAIFSVVLDLLFHSRMLLNSTASSNAEMAARTFFFERVINLAAFKRLGSVNTVRAMFRSQTRRVGITSVRSASISGVRGAIGSAVLVLDNFVFVCVAGYFVSADQLSLGTFIAVGMYKDQLAIAISSIFQVWRQYSLSLPQRLMVEKLSQLPVADHATPHRINFGSVRINNLHYSYSSLDKPIFISMDTVIEAGKFVVVRGPSGYGKSTLAKLLCGTLQPVLGSITIDGRIAGENLIGIGAVLQSDSLMSASIRENVRMYRTNVSDDEIFRALEIAEMSNLVQSMPMRLETFVGREVEGLSGGQRQRILLARALVCDPRLLVLDEAFSSLDVETEKAILKKVKALGITTVLFSHRPEACEQADSVIDLALSARPDSATAP